MADMNLYGCTDNDEYKALEDRYHQMLRDCHSYLIINTVLDMEEQGGNMNIVTDGVVELVLTGTNGSTVLVEGSNSLRVDGSADGGGQCTSTIEGKTLAEVTGSRDAGYTYALEVYTEQNAIMTTSCPKIPDVVTPLLGGSTRNITLSKSNNFTINKTEAIPGGTFTMEIKLDNPYTPLPEAN